jgi:ABC-2 type transport system ATP-binding protein
MYGMDARQAAAAIEREVARFELAEFINELTETYSHGMKQRMVFASALLHSPQVLVVDEPMVGLDPHSIRLVKDLLQWEAARGMCVLMSTHTLTAAEEISHGVGIMSHGRLLFDGTMSELRERFGPERLSLEAMYLALTETNGSAPLRANARMTNDE